MSFEKIKEKYKTLYHECREFLADPNGVWEKVMNEKRSWKDTQTRFLYPLLGLICVLGFVRVLIENFYTTEFDFLTQTLLTLAWPIILALSLVIATLVLRPLLQWYTKKTIDFERMVVFLAYTEIPLLLSAVIFAIFPFLFAVLILVNFYSAYIIMSGYNVYFADVMGEERKYNFLTTLVTFILIYASTYYAWGVLAKI